MAGLKAHERPVFDWAAAAVVIGAHVGWVAWSSSGDVLAWYGGANRPVLYGALASSVGVLVAVVSAALTLLVSSSHDRVAMLRRLRGDDAVRVMFSALTALIWLFVASLVALVVDPAGRAVGGNPAVGPSWIRWVIEGLFVLVVIRLAKVIVLHRHLLTASARPPRRSKTPAEVEGTPSDNAA